jgi:hypothetical protein
LSFYVQFAPELLRPPSLTPAKREELIAEMSQLMVQELQGVLKELGYPADIAQFKVHSLFSE